MAAAEAPPIASRSRGIASWRARHLVLLVDDDAALRLLCSLTLRAAGFAVIEAEDARRGLDQAVSGSPDVVLSDVEMPGPDGWELARALDRDDRTQGIPVVFLTGTTGAAERACAAGVRAAAFCTKPFDPVHLAPLLSHVIASSKASAVAKAAASAGR